MKKLAFYVLLYAVFEILNNAIIILIGPLRRSVDNKTYSKPPT